MGSQLLTPRINRLEPNVLINGAMELRQRVAATGGLSNAYAMDRFYVNNLNTSMTTLVDQSATVPSIGALASSQRVYNTTTGSLVAGTQCDVRYRVEGYDILPLVTSEWTLIFWARSSVAGTYSVAVKNGATTHSYVRQYTISTINTWELKCIKFPALSTCPGALLRTNGIGLEIKWSIVTGTTFQTGSLNQWAAGNFEAGAGQVSSWLTSGNEFLMTGIMALPGDWEALTSAGYQFVRCGRNFQEELAKAQRYYEKSYDQAQVPGTGAGNFNGSWCGSTPSVTGGGDRLTGPHFAVLKRATPSVVIYNPNTAGTSAVYEVNTGANKATTGFVGTGEHGVGQIGATGNSLIVNNTYLMHWTADAEL